MWIYNSELWLEAVLLVSCDDVILFIIFWHIHDIYFCSTSGTIGVLYCIMWYFLAYNTPAEHPRISPGELEYIESQVSADLKRNQKLKVPWR